MTAQAGGGASGTTRPPAITSRPRVLEISSPITAAAGRFLADAGAEVVKVEAPTPGVAAPAVGEALALRLYRDTDKRSITIDLASAAGRAVLRRLAPNFDIVLESGEPGWLASIDAGWDALHAANPGLTLASITPFGQWGPYSHYKADDLVVFAMGGMMFVSGVPELPPVIAPCEQGFVAGGIHAAMAALACWRATRLRGSPGEWIDVSLVEALAAQENTITNFKGGSDFTRREGSQHRNGNPGRVFRCKDGYVHLLIQHDEQVWARFVAWLGNPPELQGEGFETLLARRSKADIITETTARILLTRTREEIFDGGQEAHLPIAAVFSITEALADPQVVHMNVLERVPGGGAAGPAEAGYRTLRPPFQRGRSLPARRPAPTPGQDTEAVLAELGLGADEIAQLRRDGVV